MRRFFSLLFSLALLAVITGGALLYYGQQQFEAPGPATAAIEVQIPSGSGLNAIAQRLERAGAIDSADIFRLGTRVMQAERGLKAGEYEIPPRASMADILAQITDGRIIARRVTIPEEEEALILASIVEKETGVSSERGKVAGVFVNRLRRGMRLQTDPTVIYGVAGGAGLDRPIRRSDLRDRNPYNTYVIDGLPPTPIAHPGRASIEAALNPAETTAFYFVADGTGGHAFARTLDEHNRNVRQWRRIEAERAN